MADYIDNPSLWKLLVVMTVIIGITVTVLVLDKEQYFPSLYAARTEGVEKHGDSLAHETTHETQPVENEAVEAEPVEATKQPEGVATNEVLPGDYVLVAGSFLSEDYARKFQSSLEQKVSSLQPEVITITIDTATYYRVVAVQSTKETVSDLQASMESAGFKQSWVYRKN
jgi:hypothetical protein